MDKYPVPADPICEMNYSQKATVFSLWAPTAEKVELLLYKEGNGGDAYRSIYLNKYKDGCWRGTVNGDLQRQFYCFNVMIDHKWRGATPGIFAKAVGLNGLRGAILDLSETNPEGWNKDNRPILNKPSDMVVYEMHLRDLSIDPSSGITNRGKFLSLTEHGTRNKEGMTTGIDHIRELGVNAIQILPMFDYASIDESKLNANRYNWGYDPMNYNTPDGSYSTDPSDPATRIREMKQMIQSLHNDGIRVIMDVVYNHTYNIEGSNFDKTVPGYFYRYLKDGKPSNGSGCGNETASDRKMMRKFIIESACYWAKEYHIDGFRFDLMGIHDIETMKEIRAALDKIDPSITIYGEGWSAGSTALPQEMLAMKSNIIKIRGVGAFGDEMRDALRGPFNDDHKGAFLAGIPGEEESIKFGIVGAISHPDIDNSKVNYSKSHWTNDPWQMVAYVSCHDDMCLADRLRTEMPKASEKTIVALDKLAQTAVLTSQGIPFIFSGEEILRSKKFVHNSFNSPDSINAINWQLKSAHNDLCQYYRGLIQFRKMHPALRMPDAEMIRQHLRFISTGDSCVVAFKISGNANNDPSRFIVVILNAQNKEVSVNVGAGRWNVIAQKGVVNLDDNNIIEGNIVNVAPLSALIITQ